LAVLAPASLTGQLTREKGRKEGARLTANLAAGSSEPFKGSAELGGGPHSSADFKGRIPVIYFVQSRDCRRHRLDFAIKPELRRAGSKSWAFKLAFSATQEYLRKINHNRVELA
jgi:hypothetical protein